MSIRRIAMLSVHTSPLATLGGKKTGGMNVYVRELGRELGRRGIQVDVFTRRSGPGTAAVVRLGENARVIHITAGPEDVLDTAAVYPHLPEFVENTLRFVDAEQGGYDVIYSHYWLSGWAAHEFRARWKAPVLQMFHTLGWMKNRIAQEPTQYEVDTRIFVETDIMSWAERLVAATPAERAQLLWLYRADRRKIAIIPPGVDLDRFRPMPSDEAKRMIGAQVERRLLLFVGRIEPLKGVDHLLAAVALLRQVQPETLSTTCVIVIGGDEQMPDAEMSRLLELRMSLGLQGYVHFVGARDQDQLPYYYAAAEALIMPSDYESFGMVALEAMACGTPVIASEVGGLAFLIEDGVNGFHVPTREPEALAERIAEVLSGSEQRAIMSGAARRTAEEYGWSVIAEQVLALCEDARLQFEGRQSTSKQQDHPPVLRAH